MVTDTDILAKTQIIGIKIFARFKGQRDPRLGPPPTRVEPMGQAPAPAACPTPAQGANCGK